LLRFLLLFDEILKNFEFWHLYWLRLHNHHRLRRWQLHYWNLWSERRCLFDAKNIFIVLKNLCATRLGRDMVKNVYKKLAH
jgi:hypothetical protein